MPVGPPSSSPVRFGPFEVDPKSGELRKQGVRVKLQEQPLQVLQILLEHPGQVVTREELQQRLWPADTFVDFDHGLYNAIKRVREALGDVADTPRFVETIPKRGYRFIGSVTVGDQLATSASSVNGDGSPTTEVSSTSHTMVPPRTRWLAPAGTTGVLLVLGLIIGLSADGIGTRVRAAWSKPPQIHSLAVLPLKNLSDDPAQEYFSYGMTEELITDLAQISGLKVISHTSVIQYAKSSKPLPQIARELGVDGIVEGAVQRSGDRVRITAQLIYAPEEQHLWAESYDRDFRDVLTLQSSVAAAIVDPIRSRTTPASLPPRKPPSSQSVQAMEDYLQGNYSLRRIGSGDGYEGYKAAIKYYKQAISEDPNFAPAYVGLTRAYDNGFDWWPVEKIPLEKELIHKALELDPELAEAHQMNAQIMSFGCDFSGAEKEIRKAIRLNPNLAELHDDLSSYLGELGRREESLQEAHRAQELDPHGQEAGDFFAAGQYDQAIEQMKKELEIHPNDGFIYIDNGLVDAYALQGMHRESVEALARAWTLFGFKAIGQGVSKAYATSGYEGAYRYSARQMERLYAEHKVHKPTWIAEWYARSGDNEQALKWVRISVTDNYNCAAEVDGDPNFASLHSDPRFQDLVKRAAPH